MSEIPSADATVKLPSESRHNADPGVKAVTNWGHHSSFEPPKSRYMGRSMIGSLILHGGLFLVIALIMTARYVETKTEPPEKLDMVYLEQQGPGGGGGGSPAPAPAKQLEIPKPAAPPTPIPPPVPVPEVVPPPPTLNAPVMTNLSTVIQAQGTSGISLAAYGGGGSGGGIGSGTGNGVGPGTGGGFGGGAYKPGNGCVNPVPIKTPDPKYTSDAMRAKIQGDVELDIIVQSNGTVGDVRITKSLDQLYGLDQEGIRTAKNWLFRPATCQGKAVDMMVGLSIAFRLH